MLTTLDIVVLLLLGGGAVLGLLRGFVTEILSVFAWAAAMFALKLLHGPATDWLRPWVGSRSGAAVLAFVLVFAAVFVAGRMVARILGERTRASVLGPVDRLLGMGFGALKGLLIATLLYLLANLVVDLWGGAAAARPLWLRSARTYPLLNASGRAIVDFVRMRRGQPAQNDGDAGRSSH